MKNFLNIACFFLVCTPFKGFCQSGSFYEDENDFKFVTISIGASGFVAGRHVANYYNGREHNVNKMSFAMRNTQFKDDVKERLNGRDWWFNESDLPGKMRYKMTTAINFRAAINFSPNTSVFFQVNQLNLTAADIFVINVQNENLTSEPRRIQCKIWGKEARTMLDVGFQWRDDMEAQNWQWFYELALNLTNTKVRENYIEIEGLRQSIMDQGNYIPGQGFSTIAAPESAFGVGIIGSLGWRYVINSNASFDFGATAYLQDINLTGYKKFHTSFNIFARLNLLMF